MEAGVWGLSSKVFPNGRSYIDLREEGDNIIELIRKLNAAAVAREKGEDDASFQVTLDEMHDSVKRMASSPRSSRFPNYPEVFVVIAP